MPDLSPFVVKVETYLRMAGIERMSKAYYADAARGAVGSTGAAAAE